MAWRVGIVLDEDFSPRDVGALVQQMPVWALETPARRRDAEQIRLGAGEMWNNEPPFTLFRGYLTFRPVDYLQEFIGTIAEHHPSLACVYLMRVQESAELSEVMRCAGFVPTANSKDAIVFRIPVGNLANVPVLPLDARDWRGMDDVYSSFFAAVGAPKWHDRNLNALRDSIVTGSIYLVGVPCVLVIENLDAATTEGNMAGQEFIEFLREFEAEGCPISVVILS